MVIYITANIWYPQGVAIPANTIYNAIMDPLSLIGSDISEPKTICCSNDFSTHTTNITHVSINSSSCSFIGYDLGWVVMGFGSLQYTNDYRYYLLQPLPPPRLLSLPVSHQDQWLQTAVSGSGYFYMNSVLTLQSKRAHIQRQKEPGQGNHFVFFLSLQA